MSRRPWTPEQTALVRKLAGERPPREIAQLVRMVGPDHSLASLYAWASRRRLSIRPHRTAARMPDRRRYDWSDREDAALRALAGRSNVQEIADALNRRFFTARTTHSIRKRARVLGLSLRCSDGLGIQALTRTFPIGIEQVWAEVASGHLRAERQGTGTQGSDWHFLPADIEAWIRARPYLFDWRRVAAGRWRDAVRMAALRDPYLTVREAARQLGVRPGIVQKRIREGRVEGAVHVGASPMAGYRIPLRSLDACGLRTAQETA